MDFDAISAFVKSIPVDWMILGGIAVLFSFDVLRSGTERVIALALALPASVLLLTAIPEAAFLGSAVSQFSTQFLQGMLFLILFVGTYILLRRIGPSYGGEGQPLQALCAGCAGVAILVVVWLEIPALAAVWQLGETVQAVFGGQYAFWWLLGSYATLAFVRS